MGKFGLLCGIVILAECCLFCYGISCLSPSGRGVDWYVVYKTPRSEKSRSGSEFYYLDSKNTTFALYGSKTRIQSKHRNPLYKTLQQIYNNKQNLTYGMYNDQPPINRGTPKKPKNTGHTKGVYAFAPRSGFWIVSSVPRFPSPDMFKFNNPQTTLGQMLFCVNVPKIFSKTLYEIFRITKPWIYKGNGRYDETDSNVTGIFPFNSTGGDDLQVFAKSYSFGKDLYEDLVAGKLGDTLYTETWHSEYYCTDRVVDIEEIMFRDGYSFKSTQEHSKWTVTKHLNWTCIGDINRRESQFRRGGLTLCLNHAGVANEFRTLASKLSNCNDRSGRKKNEDLVGETLKSKF